MNAHLVESRGPVTDTRSFVVFSDDWGEHPSSSQHLFRHIAAHHPVIWVNTIGMRRPTASISDLHKAWRKVYGMCSSWGRRDVSDRDLTGVTVCQPLMLPADRSGLLRAFNARSVTRAVHGLVARANLCKPIVVSTVPNVGDYPGLLRDSTLVYYCVDDFAHWPGLDTELVGDMEQRLITRADVLVATSGRLYERLAASGKPTYLLSHGVDVALFSSHAAAEHSCLKGIPKPRAGFFGLIDARIDQELLALVAERVLDFSFVFSGPIDAPLDRLAARKNVHFTGPVRYGELPSLIAGLDVLLIPYAAGEFADTLSPLKLKEYLSTGKPIISTPIAAARDFRHYVTIAGSAEEWVDGLRLALSTDPETRRKAILPSMEAESWVYKARTLLEICVSHARGG
jgi:glycosyltransferase involved in cell wall biosynthesis